MLFRTLNARAFARNRTSGSILALAVLLTLLVSGALPVFSFSGLMTQAAALDSAVPAQTANNVLAKLGSHTATVVGDGSAASCNEANLRNAVGNGGNITFNCPANMVITIASQLSIGSVATTIDGSNNGHPITISGGGTTRILTTNANSVATLANLTLTNGYINAGGNDTTSGGGGAIYSDGNLTLINTTVTANTAIGAVGGGGIFINSGSLAMSYSTVSANSFAANSGYSSSSGGGIFVNAGMVSLSHSTIASNTVAPTSSDHYYGGGIFVQAGTVSLSHTNVVSNTTPSFGNGGGVYVNGGSVTINDQSSIAFNLIPSTNGCSGGGGGGIDIFGGTVTVNNSSIASNTACLQGGGIRVGENALGVALTVNNSSIVSNTVTADTYTGEGGGIYNLGPAAMVINNSSIVGNRAATNASHSGYAGGGFGGGIYNNTGTMTVTNSSILFNTASLNNNGEGGGIYNYAAATATLNNDTIAYNTAAADTNAADGELGSGGGIAGNSSITIINSSIVSNNSGGSTANSSGGGVDTGSNLATNIGNSIIADNIGGGSRRDVNGNFNSLDYNLFGSYPNSGGSITGPTTHNLNNTDPLLNSLANNGGPTPTFLPQNSSPAINAGGDSCPATDQRGVTRPQGAHCDIGAVEVGGTAPIPPTVQLTASAPSLTPTLTFTISNPNSTPLTNIGIADDLPFGLNFGVVTANSCSGGNLTLTSPSLFLSGLNLAGGSSCVITVSLNGTSGTYNTATDPITANETLPGAGSNTVSITVNSPPPTSYTYYLPLVANAANTPVGQTTTFVTFQNLSTSTAANISIQYYGLNNGTPGNTDSVTVPAKGQKAILPNVGANNSGGGIITSSQPLNVVVSEAISTGGSAYNVTSLTASNLYSPLALNGAFGGFTTNIVVFNTGSSASSGQIQFYDANGTVAATQSFSIAGHASQTLSQAGVSGLANNQSYWAKIVGASGSQLTAQVIEFGPHNFVATFNASVPTQAATKLYAPAAFNGLYGFVTGMGFANPNGTAANVTVTYYAPNGNQVGSKAVPIPANGNGSLFQGAAGTSGDVASAVVSSDQPIVMTVNESGPNNASGTYVGIANGSITVALPVMANGYASFVTGTTIFNAGSGTANLTLTYLDGAGNPVGNAQSTTTLAPNASFALYQGAANQGLPSGFFGTAIINSNQPLLVTTNALQTGTGLFYTYTEPSS